jgi:hypothetical protein
MDTDPGPDPTKLCHLTISGSTTLTSTVAKSGLPKNFTQKKNVK